MAGHNLSERVELSTCSKVKGLGSSNMLKRLLSLLSVEPSRHQTNSLLAIGPPKCGSQILFLMLLAKGLWPVQIRLDNVLAKHSRRLQTPGMNMRRK